MLKGCHNEANDDAKSHEKPNDKSGNEQIMINADETMQTEPDIMIVSSCFKKKVSLGNCQFYVGET